MTEEQEEINIEDVPYKEQPEWDNLLAKAGINTPKPIIAGSGGWLFICDPDLVNAKQMAVIIRGICEVMDNVK